MAFVTILLTVNLGLVFLNWYVLEETYDNTNNTYSLKSVMHQLLFNHILQMVFLSEFYDENGRVNTKNKWVWLVHALNYPYIIYVYISAEFDDNVDNSQVRRMWVPLDIILTFLIVCY
jgi:hypothetical protein